MYIYIYIIIVFINIIERKFGIHQFGILKLVYKSFHPADPISIHPNCIGTDYGWSEIRSLGMSRNRGEVTWNQHEVTWKMECWEFCQLFPVTNVGIRYMASTQMNLLVARPNEVFSKLVVPQMTIGDNDMISITFLWGLSHPRFLMNYHNVS